LKKGLNAEFKEGSTKARLETHPPGQSSLTVEANFATELSKTNVVPKIFGSVCVD
jgi:hypothetical protein